MDQNLLVFFCGLPFSGKTTIATIAARMLQQQYPSIRIIDIDETRRLFMGIPNPHPEESSDAEKKDVAQMSEAWNSLFFWMERALIREWPYIYTATLSSQKWGQDRLRSIYEQYPGANVRVIWCRLVDDSEKEIKRRLSRGFGHGYVGGTNSYERYLVLRERYNPITIPHHALDTSSSRTPEECAKEAVGYILS